MRFTLYVLLCGLNVYAIANAADVNVRYADDSYHFYAKFEVEAPPEQIMEVIYDHEIIADLNPVIKSSERIESPDPSTKRIRTVIRDCIMFFCKNIVRVEDVLRHDNQKLEAFLIPMLSDLRYGYTVWELQPNLLSTTVIYTAEIQIKFWVPPFIRSYVLTRKFKKRVLESVARLQEIAKKSDA